MVCIVYHIDSCHHAIGSLWVTRIEYVGGQDTVVVTSCELINEKDRWVYYRETANVEMPATGHFGRPVIGAV